MANKHIHAQFSSQLLHPRYWLLWLLIGTFNLWLLLPYRFLNKSGRLLGRLMMYLLKSRVHIARRNIEICFPDMPVQERDALLKANFEASGLAIIETGMAWFWPDWRIRKWSKVEGTENLTKARQQYRGILGIGVHFLTLELGARISGLMSPGVGVYRPHNNKLLDWLQIWGRLRSNKYLLNRRDIKGMIRALEEGEMLWYAPDHDYGAKNSVFVPFFTIENTCTTVGTSILMRAANPALVPFAPIRNKDNRGYTLIIAPHVEGFPLDDKTKAAEFVNKIIEQEIMLAPEQYMWLHRRFKTRPEGEPSLY